MYKTYDDSAAPQPAVAPSIATDVWADWNAWVGAHLRNFRVDFQRELYEILGEAISEVVAESRKDMRQERDTELLKLRAEIAELRGKLDAMLQLSARPSSSMPAKSGEVVDLPTNLWRRDGA